MQLSSKYFYSFYCNTVSNSSYCGNSLSLWTIIFDATSIFCSLLKIIRYYLKKILEFNQLAPTFHKRSLLTSNPVNKQSRTKNLLVICCEYPHKLNAWVVYRFMRRHTCSSWRLGTIYFVKYIILMQS